MMDFESNLSHSDASKSKIEFGHQNKIKLSKKYYFIHINKLSIFIYNLIIKKIKTNTKAETKTDIY